MLAIQTLKQGNSTKLADGHCIITQTSSELGTLAGFCCLLFLNKSVNSSTTHPSVAERIDSLLKTTAPGPTSALWGVASVALQMWAQQHGHNLPLLSMLETYKDLYTVMLGEAKKLP
jgi:hypothetical protein